MLYFIYILNVWVRYSFPIVGFLHVENDFIQVSKNLSLLDVHIIQIDPKFFRYLRKIVPFYISSGPLPIKVASVRGKISSEKCNLLSYLYYYAIIG